MGLLTVANNKSPATLPRSLAAEVRGSEPFLCHISPQISRLGSCIAKQSILPQMAHPHAEVVRMGTALAQTASPVYRDRTA